MRPGLARTGCEAPQSQNCSTTLYMGTAPIRKRPPPWDPHRSLGIGLRKGPRGRCFLMGEVPL